jgi:hypothetical protein
MNHARKYLAQANRHIAELVVQIASQRAIVKHALDSGHIREAPDFFAQLQRIIQRPSTG